MKKAAAVIICAALAVSLSACGKEPAPEKTITTTEFNYEKVDTAPVKVDEKLKNEKYTKADGSYAVNYYVNEGRNFDTICNYNNKGKLVDCKKFTYDEKGKTLTAFNYDGENNFKGGTAYEYNGDRLMKIYYYDENGQMKYYENRVYDSEGNIVKAPLISPDGEILAAGERTTAEQGKDKEDKKETKAEKTEKADKTEKAEKATAKAEA